MIEEPPLLTIRRPARRPTDQQIAAFRDVPTSFVVDAMFGDGAFPASIRALGSRSVAGPALTVDTGPADILALLAALPEIRPGDVVVHAFAGHTGCAAAGDRVSAMMRNCGAVGFVTDGPVRDAAGIAETGLAVWCRGTTPGSPFGKGPGRVGFPVQVAGLRVETGDMIVADADGVVVVPFERIEAVIAALPKIAELERALDQKLRDGLRVPDEIRALLGSDQVRYE